MTSPQTATHGRHKMMAFILFLTAVAYLDRICISTAAPAIREELHLTDTQMGYVFSAFTLSYALFEVPSGWLADRFGPRLMLTRIVVWWSIMTAVTGWATGFISLFIIRLLFGMGEAGTFPGISRTFARWLPPSQRGNGFGLSIMAAAIAGALTQPLVVWMLGMTGWRESFHLFGLVGFVWAACWYFWFRDDPHHHPAVNEAELQVIGSDSPKPHPPVPWDRFLRSGNLLAICGMYFGTIYGWYFYLTWLPTYLLRARDYNIKEAGWLSSLPLWSIAIGVFTGGWLSDRLCKWYGLQKGRRILGLVSLPLAALAIIGAIQTTVSLSAAIFLALAAGLAALGVGSAWAVCLDIGQRHAGTVTGAMNMFGNLGGALSPIVIGYCLDHGHSWNMPLMTLAVFYLFAAICWIFIDAGKPLEN